MTPLQQFAADHRFLLKALGDAAGLKDPVAFDADVYATPLLEASVRGPVLPLAGVMVRDWDRQWTDTRPGVRFGGRAYTVNGLRFARASAIANDNIPAPGYDFYAVGRADYAELFRTAKRLHRAADSPAPPPVLAAAVFESLKRNTLDFLEPTALERLKAWGGRAKRGVLLSGPPGNGKTSACRWVKQNALAEGYETKTVTPDDYATARRCSCAAEAVKQLFQVTGRGVIFFDDMDLALRRRDADDRPEDQAVFLGAMDGIEAHDGVVYVFTTNLPVDRIDPAFLRPGRLDATLHFPLPDAGLRRTLVRRWHREILDAVSEDRVVDETHGRSFAEVEELKNLLVLRKLESDGWDWDWAVAQFAADRGNGKPTNRVGFAAALNGKH